MGETLSEATLAFPRVRPLTLLLVPQLDVLDGLGGGPHREQ